MQRAFHSFGCLVLLLLAALAAAGSITPAEAQAPAPTKRVALVIGNSAYQHAGFLPNPKNDATDIAAALEKVGFSVILATDLDKTNMERTIRRFAQAAKGAHVSLLFYAGHGIQVAGQNYLVPIDAKLTDASGLDFELVRADLVQRTMEREAATNLLFLDACRDNPLARNLARAMGTRSVSIGRGLAMVESGIGTLISFSTQPGNVALDGDGRNSPYTTALVRNMSHGGLDISSLLIGVRREVMASTNNAQVPWEHSALTERFYFAGPDRSETSANANTSATIAPTQLTAMPAPLVAPPAAAPALPSYEQQAELALWATIRDSRNPELYQSYLERFPRGIFAPAARMLLEQTKRDGGRLPASATDIAKALAEPTPPSTEPPADPSRIALDLQGELARLGCLSGQQDGRWGAKSKSALLEFARRAKVALPGEGPSIAALAEVKKHTLRVCPPECDDNEVERDGKCVARPAPARTEPPQRAERGQRDATAPRRRTSSESQPNRDFSDGGSKSGRGGTCWSTQIGGPQFVPCSDSRSSGRRAF